MFSVFTPPEVLGLQPRLVFSPESRQHAAVVAEVLGAYLIRLETDGSKIIASDTVDLFGSYQGNDTTRGGSALPPIMLTPKEATFVQEVFRHALPPMPVVETSIATTYAVQLLSLSLPSTIQPAA